MLHILCYYLLYFLLCQIIIVSISHYHFWQNIFLQCTLNFSENNFFCSILIFGEFPILWILAGGSASLLLWKLRMPDICSTSSGVWPGLICLDTPVLDSEWSFIIFRWHRKPKEQTDKLLEIIGEFIKMTGYRISLYFYMPVTENKKIYLEEIYSLKKRGLWTVHSGDRQFWWQWCLSRGHRGRVQKHQGLMVRVLKAVAMGAFCEFWCGPALFLLLSSLIPQLNWRFYEF